MAINQILFIVAGADVNAQDKHGKTTLMEAIIQKDKDTIKMLITAGADIGKTYLHYVAKAWVRSTVITTLIKLGVDVNIKDENGNTPLMHAVWSNNKNISIINALLDGGADVNIKDKNGWAAYTHAFNLVDSKTKEKTSKWDKNKDIVLANSLKTNEMKTAESKAKTIS